MFLSFATNALIGLESDGGEMNTRRKKLSILAVILLMMSGMFVAQASANSANNMANGLEGVLNAAVMDGTPPSEPPPVETPDDVLPPTTDGTPPAESTEVSIEIGSVGGGGTGSGGTGSGPVDARSVGDVGTGSGSADTGSGSDSDHGDRVQVP